jgi:hypothetical protein
MAEEVRADDDGHELDKSDNDPKAKEPFCGHVRF